MDWIQTLEGEVTVQRMKGDGNCLFAALAHQIYNDLIPSDLHDKRTWETRLEIARHIHNNRDDFTPLLLDISSELAPRYDHIQGNLNKINQIIQDIGCDGFWGGGEAIKAATEIFELNIKIHQESGPPIWLKCARGNAKTIQIAYRCSQQGNCRNHYDSVIHLEPFNEFTMVRGRVDLNVYEGECHQNMGWEIEANGCQTQLGYQKSVENTHSNWASWNIRGGLSEGKREVIDEALSLSNIEVACLQETHLTTGNTSTKNFIWYQSGVPAQSGRGVAILIRKKPHLGITEFYPQSDSLCSAMVRIGNNQFKIINTHIPDGNEPRAGTIFGELTNAIAHFPDNKHLVILGDFNAHINKENLTEYERRFIGNNLKHQETNRNGTDLKNLVCLFKLTIHTTTGSAKKSTLTTWSNGRSESQLDHILSNCVTLISGARASWVAECSTDHKLLRAKISLGKCIHHPDKVDKRKIKPLSNAAWNIRSLAIPEIRNGYREELKTQLEIKKDEAPEVDVHNLWTAFRDTITNAATKTLIIPASPMTPNRRKAKANEQKCLFKRSRDKNDPLLKEEHKMARKRLTITKKDHEIKKCEEFFVNINSIHPSQRSNMAFKFLKQYKNNKPKRNDNLSIKKWEGILIDKGIQTEELTENELSPTIPPPPTMEDIHPWIFNAKANTAPGIDKLQMELIKEGPDEIRKELLDIITKVWTTNIIPKDWTTTVQVPIPKISNPKEIDDWRRISLCSVAYKIYARFLLKSLEQYIPEPHPYQAAFQKGRSTDDHIFTARRVLEERWRMGLRSIIVALDLSKAFDTIKHKELAIILKQEHTPVYLINRIIKACFHEETLIQWKGQKTALFPKTRGVKQGCPISPRLFTIALNAVIETTTEETGLFLLNNNCSVPMILAYADDVLLIADEEMDIKEFMDKLIPNLSSVGLSLNLNKCQVTLKDPSSTLLTNPNTKMDIGGYSFSLVTKIKYLGIYITQNLNRTETVKERIKKANRTVRMFIPFLKKYRPPWSVCRSFYSTIVVPAVIYGLKTATITKENRVSLQNFENLTVKLLTEFCFPMEKDQSTEELLRGKTINKKVIVQRLRYWGHIQRRPEDHILRNAKNLRCKRKKVGRPCFTWNTTLNQDLKRLPQGKDEWEKLAMEKEKLYKATNEIYKIQETALGFPNIKPANTEIQGTKQK